jgi:hypothetical protein
MFSSLKTHIKAMLSGRHGTISSARVMMFLFGTLSVGLLLAVFRHMFKITNPELLSVWIGGLPSIGGILVALCSVPYTANKGFNSMQDILAAFMNAKNGIQPLIQEQFNKNVTVDDTTNNTANNTVNNTVNDTKG